MGGQKFSQIFAKYFVVHNQYRISNLLQHMAKTSLGILKLKSH